jgi:hypothetical protein
MLAQVKRIDAEGDVYNEKGSDFDGPVSSAVLQDLTPLLGRPER